MKLWLKCLAASLIVVVIGSYMWLQRRRVVRAVAQRETVNASRDSYEEEREAQKMVEVNGPLANYVTHQKPAMVGVETPQRTSFKPGQNDHAGGSVTGTSNDLVAQTLLVQDVANVPFEVPAHAATPQLRGKYRSFVKHGGAATSDASADVEFMVMNQEQYDAMVNGQAGDAVFSAEAAHDGEIDCRMPPTFGQPKKYYLVFRNSQHGVKKFVEEKFRIDF